MNSRSTRHARYWDRQAATFDDSIAAVDRRFLAASRRWVCERADGATLEIATGTGLNLPYYPAQVELTCSERSGSMLAVARRRAGELGRAAHWVLADAGALPYPDETFDSLVCTYSLCGVQDPRRSLTEALRVLRPGGSLLLADHVAAENWLVRSGQYLLDLVTVPLQGEHWTRRPLPVLEDLGADVVATDRLHLGGVIERVHARKPTRRTTRG